MNINDTIIIHGIRGANDYTCKATVRKVIDEDILLVKFNGNIGRLHIGVGGRLTTFKGTRGYTVAIDCYVTEDNENKSNCSNG